MTPPAGWRPTASLEAARERARMLAAARDFFARHDVLEVETPALSKAAVSDPQIESVGATLRAVPGMPYFLHTSPEFAMKRLLAAGWPDVYQVCKVFRDGEVGRRHQPEFTMVEWYRLGTTFSAMMRHAVDFLAAVLDADRLPRAPRYLGYADAFAEFAGLDPLAASTDELARAVRADAGLARALGDDRDAWLDLVLTQSVAPRFAPDGLTVLHHFPVTQAALARRCPDDDRVADRFEVFLGEVELANGYHELTDSAEQRARIDADQRARRRRGQPARPLDERFLAAMDAGLPDCCGVAVGFDRLVMINTGSKTLAGVQTFTAVETDLE